MNEVFIVVKKSPVKLEAGFIDFSTNEAVFATEKEAKEYINKRRSLKDRDDKGATFGVEPWHVQTMD